MTVSVIDQHPRKSAIGAALTGACLALCVSTVAQFEGKRNYTYFDIVGVPTYCYGGTGSAAVKGATFTDAQCDAQLSASLQSTWQGMLKCTPEIGSLPDASKVAFVSLSYNVGAGAWCKSSIPAKLARNDLSAACQTLALYDRAAGVVVKGLQIRRQAELKLCLSGLPSSGAKEKAP